MDSETKQEQATVNYPVPKENVGARLVAGIEHYLLSAESFGEAEEMLLATWLLCRKDLNFNIDYDHFQTRKALRFTFNRDWPFIKGIKWDYDIDNDDLGDVYVEILGHEFSHHAVWERYSDYWFDDHWINMDMDLDVCKELDEVLNSRVHCGGCDDCVFSEDPFVNEGIIASVLENTRRENHCCYFLADSGNRVYIAVGKIRDGVGAEFWQVIDGWSEIVALMPLVRMRQISEEECIKLLLQQELIISDGFGNSEDMMWSPSEKRLLPICDPSATSEISVPPTTI